MENIEIKIECPEGYEIDKENSTFEKIICKRKSDDKPRTWEEFCERGFTGEEAYINASGIGKSSHKKGDYRYTTAVGYIDSVEEAEAFVALIQLRQLRKAWVGDWEPKYSSGRNENWHIHTNKNSLIITWNNYISRPLSFPTKTMADEFLICFKDLLEIAKILL